MNKKPIAIIIALLFIMQMLSISKAVDTGSSVEVKLYLRDDGDGDDNKGILNTTEPSNSGVGGETSAGLATGQSAFFSSIELEKNIIGGKNLGGNDYGFKATLYFRTRGDGSTDAKYKAHVYDTDVKIASSDEFSVPAPMTSTVTERVVNIKFLETRQNYNFSIGDVVKLEVQPTQQPTGVVVYNSLLYDHTSYKSNLEIYCNYLSHTADTYNKDEETEQKTWQPNLPEEEKKIVIKGVIQDAFSNADFQETDEGDDDDAITISIKYDSTGEEILNDTISKNDNDVNANKSITKDATQKEYKYRYIFDYKDKTMDIGSYTVYVYVNTKQHTFLTKTYFNISEFGIFIKVQEGQDEIENNDKIDLSTGENKPKELKIDILNTGSKSGEVNLKPLPKDYWNINPSKFNLNAGENKTVILKFENADAKDGERFSTTVYADLIVDNVRQATHEIVVEIRITKRYLLNMETTVSSNIFAPAENHTFYITIENNGGDDDTYNFSIPNKPSGWDIKDPEPKTLSVKKGERKENALKVEVKASNFNLDGNYTFDVIGENGRTGAENTSDKITFTLKARVGIKLTVEGRKTEIFNVETKKEERTFTIKVENTDDKNHEYELYVKSSGLSAILGISSINLTAGSSQNVNLIVSAEKGKDAGDYNITISGKIKATDRIANDYINIKIKQYYKMQVDITGGEEKVKPGEEITYRINIKNLGNGDDSFSISYSAPSDWEIKFGNGSSTGTIKPTKTGTITMKITAPKAVRSGDKATINIIIKSDKNSSYTETETLTITIEKSLFEKIVDSFKDSWYFFVLLIAVFLVFVFVQKQRRQVYK